MNACKRRFRGSSGRSAAAIGVPSPGVPPNTEPDIREGFPSPLGEADREPVGVEVEAKREETEALEGRYGRVDTGDAKGSVEALIFGSLMEGGPVGGPGGSKGEALLEDVMKIDARHGAFVTVEMLRSVAEMD